MKNFIVLIILHIAVLNVQSQPYKFSVTNEIYITNENLLSLWADSYWSYSVNSFPRTLNIGFDFNFFGHNYNEIDVLNTGLLKFVRADWPGMNDYLYMLGTKLKARTNKEPWVSQIAYKKTGTAPNRILIVEYNNLGFEASSDTGNFINFQVLLFETSNKIQMRYGPSRFDTSCWWYNKGAYIGMDTSNGWSYFLLAGNPNNPIYVKADTQLVSGPVNGTVYTFEPIINSVKDYGRNFEISVFPNPVKDKINISVGTFDELIKFELVDIKGQITEIPFNRGLDSYNMDISDMSNGVYALKICYAGGFYFRKLLKE